MYCTSCGTPRTGVGAYCMRCGTPFPIVPAAAEVQDVERQGPSQPRYEQPHYAGFSPPPGRRARGPLMAVVAVLLVSAVAVGAVLLTRANQGNTASTAPAQTPTGQPPSSTTSPGPSVGAPASFADLYRQSGNGVVRIETTACGSGGVGSGFLIAPDLIATVAHVVDGSRSIVLRQGASTMTGTVVGFDRGAELALVRASEPLGGHVFTLATTQPDVGTDVAAIGYPLAGEESLTKGTISGLDRPVQTDTASLTGLLQTDTPLNPGNSGGPLLLANGTVVGVVDAKDTAGDNIGYAIPAASAGATLRAWQQAPTPVQFGSGCAAPLGPSVIGDVVTDGSGSPDGPAVAQTFSSYTSGINHGDYASAFAQLTPALQGTTGYSSFVSGTQSSYIVDLLVSQVGTVAAGKDTAEVTFTSLQDAAHGRGGQTCSEWRMTYTLVQSATGWQIDAARPHTGSPVSC